MKLNKYWFRPKIYGYGATPISWEGWFFVLSFILVLYFLVVFARENFKIFLPLILIWAYVLIIVSKRKTKGKWMWRWGN